MENASKALIIAGAILLAILIIGLGVMVFNNANKVTEQTGLDEQTIATFNNKFEAYVGSNVPGSNVRALCDAVMSANSDTTNKGFTGRTISVNGKTANTDISALKTNIKAGNKYTVQITGYTNDGYVSAITFK